MTAETTHPTGESSLQTKKIQLSTISIKPSNHQTIRKQYHLTSER